MEVIKSVERFGMLKSKIKAPMETHLSCKGWQQEAAFRMIQNNLDSNVAEDPDHLIVYGGRERR